MAIKKQVVEENGIVTEYHRIALFLMDIGNKNTILVHSYLSEAGRQIEKDYAAGLYKDVEEGFMKWPYVNAQYIHLEYDSEMTLSKAYEYLKTLPQFIDAEDI